MKTLKDFTTIIIEEKHDRCISRIIEKYNSDLRQSAIEDIKTYLKRKEEIKNGYEHSKPLRIEMYELNAKIEYIKEKNNLTDEDLK